MSWSAVTGGKIGPTAGTTHASRQVALGAVSVGDLIVAEVTRAAASDDLASDTLSDSLGNVWHFVGRTWDPTDARGCALWYAVVSVAGSPTVTATYSGGAHNYDSLCVEAYRSSLGTPALDVSAAISGFSTCTWAGANGAIGPSVTPTVNGCLVVGGFANFQTTPAFTAGTSPAATGDQITNDAGGCNALLEHLEQATAAAIQLAATISTVPARFGAVVAAFIPSASAPPDAPANVTAPAISGTARVGEQLQTTDGEWSGNPTSYTYQWQNDGGSAASEPAVVDNFGAYSSGSIATQAPSVWPAAWGDTSGNADGSGHYGGDGTSNWRGNYYATGGKRTAFRAMFTINAAPGTSSDNGLWFNFRTVDRDNSANPPTGLWTGYSLELKNVGGSKTYRIFKQDDGGVVDVQPTTALAYGVGDVFGIICNGTAIELWRKPSGGSWAIVNSWTDSLQADGWVGFEFHGTTTPKVDDFAVENATGDFGADTGGWQDIADATANSYLLDTSDGSLNVRCEVTATNTAGSAAAYSNELLIDTSSAVAIPRLTLLFVGGGAPGSTPEPPPTPGGDPQFGGPRIYATDSPWNTPLPPDWWSHLHPDTVTMITGYVRNTRGNWAAWGPIPGWPYSTWLGPRENVGRWWVLSTQPTTPVACYFPSPGHTSYPPIPTGFVIPHFGSDDEGRSVIHVDNGDSWQGMYVAHPSGYTAAMFDKRNTAGARWRGLGDGSDQSVSSGASYCPFDAGALSWQDFQNCPPGGHFDHALNINFSSSANGTEAGHPKYVWPASQGDGTCPTKVGIPLGARIGFNPNVNIDTDSRSVSLPEWMKQILRTLQVYGCMPTDTSGGQGAGDGIMALLHECGPSGYHYPFSESEGDAYTISIPTSLMVEFGVLDWNWHWPGGNP